MPFPLLAEELWNDCSYPAARGVPPRMAACDLARLRDAPAVVEHQRMVGPGDGISARADLRRCLCSDDQRPFPEKTCTLGYPTGHDRGLQLSGMAGLSLYALGCSGDGPRRAGP